MTDRYIILSDTIIDREKIIALYMKDGKVVVQLMGAEDHTFEGQDASTLWKYFDRSDWRDE